MALFEETIFGREDKVQKAIDRLKAFEPKEGYYLAFSGGKDSQTVYHLCEMAGVKFDAHYSVTSIDPPELMRFIKKQYPDVEWEYHYWDDDKPEHHYPDGRPRNISMWSLIADHTIPPTRQARYCCSQLKETGGLADWWSRVSGGQKAHGARLCMASPTYRRRARSFTHRQKQVQPTR